MYKTILQSSIVLLALTLAACQGQLCSQDESICAGYSGETGEELGELICTVIDGLHRYVAVVSETEGQ
jgi:hypothetical protein